MPSQLIPVYLNYLTLVAQSSVRTKGGITFVSCFEEVLGVSVYIPRIYNSSATHSRRFVILFRNKFKFISKL